MAMNASAAARADTSDGMSRYLAEIRKYPILSAEREAALATQWIEHRDPKAHEILVGSHLRYAVKLAMQFRGYGLPILDLISQANVGLVIGVNKFDPTKGFRASTFVQWWIKAELHKFVLENASIVKMGTTGQQKTLFYRLKGLKSKLNIHSEGAMSQADAEKIAKILKVTVNDVQTMDQRMGHGGDASLNVRRGEDEDLEFIDLLKDDGMLQDDSLAERQQEERRRAMLHSAMSQLTERERDILTRRHVKDEVETLEALGNIYSISRERIRQIEKLALAKVRKTMLRMHANQSEQLVALGEW